MTRDKKDMSIICSVTLALWAGTFAYLDRHDLMDAYRDWQRGPIPQAVSRADFDRMFAGVPTVLAEDARRETVIAGGETREAGETDAEEDADDFQLPASSFQLNLKVPFTVQAPYANWDDLHNEGCEEASAIMLKAYYDGEAEITPEEAEERILALADWETETFGYHLDTSAEEVARVLREYFGLPRAQAVTVTSIDDIKASIASGHPVIVPAYGRALGNPNFRGEGPLYHMLVIKGYTDTKFITNDPGTKRGADFTYDFDTIWNALHDWNGGDVENGAKMVVMVK